MDIETLIAERGRLAEMAADLDNGDFPGSKGWLRYNAALKALQAFDAAHPEVLPEMQRRHSARVLGGKDVGGL